MSTAAQRISTALASALLAASVEGHLAAGAQKGDKEQEAKRPKLTLRARPGVGMAPVHLVLTAELVGGADDFEEYYCPGVTWDWGDDTLSESSTDCPPYEAGKSEIKRRFTVEHIFKRAGSYRIYVRLKQRTKEVGAVSTTVQIQPGPGDAY